MSDHDLINKVGLMFMDAMSVRCEPSSYAVSAIALVRSYNWQPIETAPREPYAPIDLWVVPGIIPRLREREKPHRIANATSSGNGKHWLEKGRFIEGRHFYDEDGDACFDPDDRGPDATIVTHWMPLPEPPNGKSPT
jgi:hypothetical protein